MSIRTNLSVLVAVALAFGIGWTACTSETQQGGGNEPTPGGNDKLPVGASYWSSTAIGSGTAYSLSFGGSANIIGARRPSSMAWVRCVSK